MRLRESHALPSGVEPSRLKVRDLIVEAASSIGNRPGRSLLTGMGTLLGIAAFVATSGLTATASAQISSKFDALKATEVVVKDSGANQEDTPILPDDVEDRLSRLNGVRAAALIWTTQGVSKEVTARPFERGGAAPVAVIAASSGIFDAAHAQFGSGRGFDSFHRSRSERVAVLGPAAARQLGVVGVDKSSVVFLNGTPFEVVGVLADVDREPDLLAAVIVPDTTVTSLYGQHTGREQAHVLVDVSPGAAQLIGSQVALALAPQDPRRLEVLVPPEPRKLRQGVETDSVALFYVLAGFSLIVGTVGIANTTLVAVLERTYEIGLRRAMGATRRHVSLQFLSESAALGALGGLLGTLVGLLATICVSVTKHWVPTMPPLALLLGPLIGALTGVVAGVYPSRRAARTQPVTALRKGG